MDLTTKALEVRLGPDTGDLALRIGIHSGPVTGGILRGERSRFQLFGDTMNTCARLEATGAIGKIHLSKATADILLQNGKGTWVERRHDMVYAKGKGSMETFWLTGTGLSEGGNSQGTPEEAAEKSATNTTDAVINRLIDWNTSTLADLLKKVIASRSSSSKAKQVVKPEQFVSKSRDESFLDEVAEIVPVAVEKKEIVQCESHELPNKVEEQLRHYVDTIAKLYRDNAFHSFKHASHVL